MKNFSSRFNMSKRCRTEFEETFDLQSVMTRAKQRKLDRLTKNLTIRLERIPTSVLMEIKKYSADTNSTTITTQPKIDLTTANLDLMTREVTASSSVFDTQNNFDDRIANKLPNSPPKNMLTIAKPDFKINEIIWAKIKGSVHWPAKIDRILSKSNGTIMYDVIWYNDYRRSKIYKLQAVKFLENFEKYSERFDDVVGLKTAAFEAMYEYRTKE